MEFFSALGKKIGVAAQGVQEKTVDGIESTKISSELRSIRSQVEKLYASLGEVYYKTAADSAEGELRAICDEIGRYMAQADELNARKKEITGKGHCPACGKPIKNGSRFCANCGTKIEEKEPEKPKGDACPDCGAAIRPGIRFCTNCGRALDAEEKTSVNLERTAEEPGETEE